MVVSPYTPEIYISEIDGLLCPEYGLYSYLFIY